MCLFQNTRTSFRSYNGRRGGVSSNPRYLELNEHVGIDIHSAGQNSNFLHSGSITAQKIQRLFNHWLRMKAGEIKVPEDRKNILDYLFDTFPMYMLGRAKGIVLDNGIDYNDHGNLPKKEGYSRALIVTAPKRFYNDRSEQWKIEIGEVDPTYDYVPLSGFPILTNDGVYNPDTFIPFATTPSREAATQSYIKKGVRPDIAVKAIGNFSSRSEGQGVSCVIFYTQEFSGFDDDTTRFGLDATDKPDFGVGWIGHLDSQPADHKLIEVSETEYLYLISRADRAIELEENISAARKHLQK